MAGLGWYNIKLGYHNNRMDGSESELASLKLQKTKRTEKWAIVARKRAVPTQARPLGQQTGEAPVD